MLNRLKKTKHQMSLTQNRLSLYFQKIPNPFYLRYLTSFAKSVTFTSTTG